MSCVRGEFERWAIECCVLRKGRILAVGEFVLWAERREILSFGLYSFFAERWEKLSGGRNGFVC